MFTYDSKKNCDFAGSLDAASLTRVVPDVSRLDPPDGQRRATCRLHRHGDATIGFDFGAIFPP